MILVNSADELDIAITVFKQGDDATIMINKDFQVDYPILISRDVKIDLNGHRVDFVNNANLIVSEATVTLTDSKWISPIVNQSAIAFNVDENGDALTSSGNIIIIRDSGKVIIDKINIYSSSDTPILVGIRNSAGELTVESGYICGYKSAIEIRSENSKLTVDGGMLQALTGPVITGNESNGLGGTEITINQGLFWGHSRDDYLGCTVYHPQDGTLTINNGTFRAPHGIPLVIRAGQININNGKFFTEGSASGKIGDSENILNATDLFIDGMANYSGWENCYTTVNGGTFNLGVNSENPAIIVTAPSGEDSRDYLEVNIDNFSSAIEYR